MAAEERHLRWRMLWPPSSLAESHYRLNWREISGRLRGSRPPSRLLRSRKFISFIARRANQSWLEFPPD